MVDEQKKTPSPRHHVWLEDEDLGIFDERKISLSDGFLIQGQTGGHGAGLTPQKMLQGIVDGDPRSFQALVWFLKYKQNPSAAPHITTIDFNYADLRIEDEPDPTEARTGTGDAATSDPSPNSAD